MRGTTTTMAIATKETIADTDVMTANTVDTAIGEMTANTVMETIMTGITPMATTGTGDMTEITTTTMATETNQSVTQAEQNRPACKPFDFHVITQVIDGKAFRLDTSPP